MSITSKKLFIFLKRIVLKYFQMDKCKRGSHITRLQVTRREKEHSWKLTQVFSNDIFDFSLENIQETCSDLVIWIIKQ